jgi:uncharacterized protein
MIRRILEPVLADMHQGYPAVAVFGPRQSGKTTLCRRACAGLGYVNLESPMERAAFADDPVGFLSRFKAGAVLDEVQNVPDLLSYLQVRIDEAPNGPKWVLTGSQQIDLVRGVTQSLAGRVAMLELLPFSYAELKGVPQRPGTLVDAVITGGYPPLFDSNRKLPFGRWLDDYLATFVNRDVRQLLDVRDRNAFDRFVRLCAARTAQILNVADLARDADISHKTASAWLSVLEACYLIRLVRPHHENFGKRMVKSPKLFFLDSGLACRLLGITTTQQLRLYPLWGALAETWMVGEVVKAGAHRGQTLSLWYWRSSDGLEIDLMIEQGNALIPIECKATETAAPTEAKNIRHLRTLSRQRGGALVSPGFIVYAGDEARVIGEDRFVPWTAIDEAVVGCTHS